MTAFAATFVGKFLLQDSSMSKERLNRRDFLKVGASTLATGLATGSASYGALSLFSPLLERPLDSKDIDFVERNGVYISGENKVFEIEGKEFRTRVNEFVFLETLQIAAARAGKSQELKNFLLTHPLHISLHRNNRFLFLPTLGTYADSTLVRYPEMRFSTTFLRSYFAAQKARKINGIKYVDNTIVHESQHLVQDSSSNLIKFSKAMNAGIMSSNAILFSQLPGLIAKPFLPEEPSLREKYRKQIEHFSLITAVIGLVNGAALGELISPAEAEARKVAESITRSPVFKKYSGKYFEFEKTESH